MARITIEEKRRLAVIDIFNQMFTIAGHEVTFEDIKDRKDDWYRQWTMTVEQGEELKIWGIAHLRKTLKLNKYAAEREMTWFNLQWGLMYSNYKNK